MNSVGWQGAAWGRWHIKHWSVSLLRSTLCLEKWRQGHRSHPSALPASIPGHQADGAGAALSWEDTRGVVMMDCSSAFLGQLCTKGKGCSLVLDPLPLPVVKAETKPCFNSLAWK